MIIILAIWGIQILLNIVALCCVRRLNKSIDFMHVRHDALQQRVTSVEISLNKDISLFNNSYNLIDKKVRTFETRIMILEDRIKSLESKS